MFNLIQRIYVLPFQRTPVQSAGIETRSPLRAAAARTIRRRQRRAESRDAVFRAGVRLPQPLSGQIRHADGYRHRRAGPPRNRRRHDPDAARRRQRQPEGCGRAQRRLRRKHFEGRFHPFGLFDQSAVRRTDGRRSASHRQQRRALARLLRQCQQRPDGRPAFGHSCRIARQDRLRIPDAVHRRQGRWPRSTS